MSRLKISISGKGDERKIKILHNGEEWQTIYKNASATESGLVKISEIIKLVYEQGKEYSRASQNTEM